MLFRSIPGGIRVVDMPNELFDDINTARHDDIKLQQLRKVNNKNQFDYVWWSEDRSTREILYRKQNKVNYIVYDLLKQMYKGENLKIDL